MGIRQDVKEKKKQYDILMAVGFTHPQVEAILKIANEIASKKMLAVAEAARLGPRCLS